MKEKKIIEPILLAMKMTFTQVVLATVLSFSVSAHVSNAQTILDKTITLSVSREEVKDVLLLIQKQTNVKFLYSPSAIDMNRPISFNGTNVKLKEFFDRAFSPINIGYKVFDEKILLYSTLSNVQTPRHTGLAMEVDDRRITGTVTGPDGKPLANVNIRLRGSETGTFTDESGRFSLPVPDGPVVLEVSHVGYIMQTVTVTGNTVAVVLESNAAVQTEVVVTALGISKSSKKIGYSVTKISGELLSVAKESNVAYSLEGRVPGLNISGVNSGPGGSARILVRGITNFTSSTGPLFVIDGVPMDNTQKGSPGLYGGQDKGDGISSINPDDIENIVVLKGSTASALYGVRAANGVIQITTKSGKGQKGFGVELNSNYTLSSIVDNTDYQKAYGQGVNGLRPNTVADITATGLNSWGELLDGEPTIGMDGEMHPYSKVNNQKNAFYRVAPVFTTTVSVVNGGENGYSRFSLSYLDNQSVIPNSGLKRYTANLNITQNITSDLKLMLMANYIDEKTRQRPSLNDMSGNVNWTMNLLPANVHPDYLKPGFDPTTGYEHAMNSDGYMPNPWFIVNRVINEEERKRLISSVALRYDIMKNLYLQARSGYDLSNDHAFNIEPTGIGYNRKGQLHEKSKAQTSELNLDVMAGYSRPLFFDITLDATVGGNMRKFKYEKTGIGGSEWKQPFLYTPSNLVSTRSIYGFQEKRTNSGYYTVDFGYQNFLTVSTTGRYDVFSTLPSGNRGIFTPSVSSSLIFTELVDIPKLNYGKLRLSYAETSGEADPYKTSVYYQVQEGTNGGLPFGNMLDEVANMNLQPFRLKEFEAGLELKGFRNRVGLDITYFYRRTEGELIRKQISIASGYSYSYEKLGSTENQGLELMLNVTPVKSSTFAWNTSFNLTVVENKLLSIDGTGNPSPIRKDGEGQYRPSVGPYNNGAFVASVQGLPIAQIMAYDYKYDAKGNIMVGENGIPLRGELKAMGSGLPKYYGGFHNEFIYKRFNFSFLVDYKFGNKVLSGTDFLSIYYGLNKTTLPGREDGVVVKGVTAEGSPNYVLVNAQDYYKGLATNVSTISVFDGSFIKLRQATLGYSFGEGVLQKTPFQSVNVSLVARNLLTLLKHTTNFDPEDCYSSLPGNAGLEGGTVPQTRTYGINLNFKFKK